MVMDDSKDQGLPPSYEETEATASSSNTEPTTILLEGESLKAKTPNGSVPLYRLSRNVTQLSPDSTSVQFMRVDLKAPEKAESSAPPTEETDHLFYLVHPRNARFRSDAPSYYMTCTKSSAVGNIRLEAASSRLKKTEFRALLSPGRSAKDGDLFSRSEELLFHAKTPWKGTRRTWYGSNGDEIAFEDDDGSRALVITAGMDKAVRDALVATWCLQIWHDTAETNSAKREELERLTDPDSVMDGGTKFTRKVPGLAALSGLGSGRRG